MGIEPLTVVIAPWHSIAEERQKRLESRRREGAEAPQVFAAAIRSLSGAGAERLADAYAYAAAIEYRHPGLTSASYLAHPVRVMEMSVRLTNPPDVDAGVLSLLHNLYEVSSVEPPDVAARFGRSIADGISALTVNRAEQSAAQVAAYYRALADAPVFVRVVKVLDKVDNLFLLGLNADAQVRDAYLTEVETFVAPLAEDALPHFGPYLAELVDDCRREGFFVSTRE